MASTDFFNPKKFDIFKIGAVSQYLAQKVIGLTPAQGAAPCIMCCLMAPEDLIGASRLCHTYSAPTAENFFPELVDIQYSINWFYCTDCVSDGHKALLGGL